MPGLQQVTPQNVHQLLKLLKGMAARGPVEVHGYTPVPLRGRASFTIKNYGNTLMIKCEVDYGTVSIESRPVGFTIKNEDDVLYYYGVKHNVFACLPKQGTTTYGVSSSFFGSRSMGCVLQCDRFSVTLQDFLLLSRNLWWSRCRSWGDCRLRGNCWASLYWGCCCLIFVG